MNISDERLYSNVVNTIYTCIHWFFFACSHRNAGGEEEEENDARHDCMCHAVKICGQNIDQVTPKIAYLYYPKHTFIGSKYPEKSFNLILQKLHWCHGKLNSGAGCVV